MIEYHYFTIMHRRIHSGRLSVIHDLLKKIGIVFKTGLLYRSSLLQVDGFDSADQFEKFVSEANFKRYSNNSPNETHQFFRD